MRGRFNVRSARGVVSLFAMIVAPPPISTLLKPAILKDVVEGREAAVHASLEDGKRYSFYASVMPRASLAATRRILTDYRLYSQIIPYIEKTRFSPDIGNPASGILELWGGIWKFQLRSYVRFDERSERWIHYRIVGGHFAGLQGEIYFEPRGEEGTLVYLSGAIQGEQFPPKLVIERGAEIVFGFTARRMRSYVEAQKTAPSPPRPVPGPALSGGKHDAKNPEPRARLRSPGDPE